ncbi:unnamed protein product [Bursaphelenchus xylophilus]|uniref:(pine wood nematode) hypothetical protein n=1 Tax=Bursaphelenchus xylophilus TaxID=6326 RepID=A0A1I7RZV7_BURXY|nr:unnamed protein product [Bursaphelenchus xylophilus]CAG9109195.1 unnamed protein product [Bursaphelenchus xylophilus]
MEFKTIPPHWKLSEAVWIRIINKIPDFYSVCRLALTHEDLNKIIGIDFRQLCLDNKMYRFPGETWEQVVVDAHNRLWNDCTLVNPYNIRFEFDSRTDRFGLVGYDYAVILSLDFDRPFLRFINIGFPIYRFYIVENGRLMVAMTPGSCKVFDIESQTELLPDDLEKFNYTEPVIEYQGGFIRDVLSQKFSKIDICSDEPFCDPVGRYVQFRSSDEMICVRNIESNHEMRIEILDPHYSTKILKESGCLLVQFHKSGVMQIHHIDSSSLLFKAEITDVWKAISDCIILDEQLGEFLVFDATTLSWDYSTDLYLNTEIHETIRRPAPEFRNFGYFDIIPPLDRYENMDQDIDMSFDDDFMFDFTDTEQFNYNRPIENEPEHETRRKRKGLEEVEMLFFDVLPNHRLKWKIIKTQARRPHPYISLHAGISAIAENHDFTDGQKQLKMEQFLIEWIPKAQEIERTQSW